MRGNMLRERTRQNHRGRSAVARRLLALLALALPLAACQLDVFLGYGLPDNEACRDGGALPSRPLSTDCLDSLGK